MPPIETEAIANGLKVSQSSRSQGSQAVLGKITVRRILSGRRATRAHFPLRGFNISSGDAVSCFNSKRNQKGARSRVGDGGPLGRRFRAKSLDLNETISVALAMGNGQSTKQQCTQNTASHNLIPDPVHHEATKARPWPSQCWKKAAAAQWVPLTLKKRTATALSPPMPTPSLISSMRASEELES